MPPPVRFTGMTRRLFGMKLQVSARQGSVARIRDTGTRNGDVEGVVSDSGLAVIARLVHRKAVSVDVVHTRAAGKGHAGAADQVERVDRQAVDFQALSVVSVLELAVEYATSRTDVEPESGDIAAGPELPATGHERVARLGSWHEVHVAVGRGDDDVARDRPRHGVIEHDVDHVHGKRARVHAVPLEDLRVEDHSDAGK